jgi:putative membrane protein insertion efficiency factor
MDVSTSMNAEQNSRITLRGLPRLGGRALIYIYRNLLSPLIGPRCRHLPSCSEYADEAVSRFGLWAGSWMALARITRCHPWGTHGVDFVPSALPAHAHWYAPWRYGRWRGTNEAPPPERVAR